ncbi:MAG: (d)CMP kinase [Synergistaceae bacterium]|jgi:cytidylate kinase|nr:(d)CMP kinase [Synergistaceae bacterium]
MSGVKKQPVIVLDGPAGAGKSSIGREAACRLGLPFLDTGAIYRAITFFMLRDGIAAAESPELAERLREFTVSFRNGTVFACGEDVTEAIRSPGIDKKVSSYSALPMVREFLLGIQRDAIAGGLVAEGRDMGTVVFPDADVKIFLTAAPETRARRRYDERIARGESVDYGEILEQVNRRDTLDRSRDVAPLKPALDAVVLDTTDLSFDEVLENVLEYAARL